MGEVSDCNSLFCQDRAGFLLPFLMDKQYIDSIQTLCIATDEAFEVITFTLTIIRVHSCALILLNKNHSLDVWFYICFL